jgi:hypothetical protein
MIKVSLETSLTELALVGLHPLIIKNCLLELQTVEKGISNQEINIIEQVREI